MSSFLQNLNDKMRKASADIAPKAKEFRDQVNEKIAEVYHGSGTENPLLYTEDEALAEATSTLNQIRTAFKEIVHAVDAHYRCLRTEAAAEKKVGEKILQVAAFEKFYSPDTIAAHLAAGKAEISSAAVLERFAADMNSPLQELNRNFEERFAKQVVPLKKRYVTQKNDYLKYRAQMEKEDDDSKRSHMAALAEAARPVWMDTSTQLKAESESLSEAIATSLSEWTLKMIGMHKDSYVSMSNTFKETESK